MSPKSPPRAAERQPIFTMPAEVSALIGTILVIFAAYEYVLDDASQSWFNLWFAFIPFRMWNASHIPGGWVPMLWTPVTHAFLHASWPHVLVNSAWLAIFGTPVAQRYGAVQFYLMFALSAVAGAFLFAAFASPDLQVLVGASGGISGLMGAAMRFIFEPVQIDRDLETGEPVVLGRRLASLRGMMRNNRARTFIVVWLLLNAASPILPAVMGGPVVAIAWQAHIGGFVFGLLAVPLLEVRRRPVPDQRA